MNAYSDSQTSGNVWASTTGLRAYQEKQETPILPAQTQQAELFADLERQMSQFEAEHEATLRQIAKHYVIRVGPSLKTFLDSHRTIPQLLIEAIPHLRKHFGEDAVFALRIPMDEAASPTLYAVVMWAGDARDAMLALDKFEDDWWISNSQPASGSLNVTYELV